MKDFIHCRFLNYLFAKNFNFCNNLVVVMKIYIRKKNEIGIIIMMFNARNILGSFVSCLSIFFITKKTK